MAIKLFWLGALAAMLAACSLTPDYQAPEMALPQRYRAPGAASTPLPKPAATWWTRFGSPELNSLVDKALSNSFTLKAAVSRVAQAQAQAVIAGASLLPTINLATGDQMTAPDIGIGGPIQAHQPIRSKRLRQFSLRSSYEVDLWGKNASNAESALAQAEANELDQQTVTLSLVSSVATTYFQYLLAEERLALAQKNLETINKMLGTISQLLTAREATVMEVNQQKNSLAQAEALIPALTLQREQALDQLALLLGIAPGELKLSGKTLSSLKIPEISSGLPSELLYRRPDIGKVEATLRAANANIGVARAKFLPSFSLQGEFGVGSSHLPSLLIPGAIYYSLIGSVVQSIFDNGRAEAEYEYNKARYEELVQIYRQTILQALKEVEDSLAAVSYLEKQEEVQKRVVETAEQTNVISKESYLAGFIDYLNYLETERTRYRSEDDLTNLRFQRLNSSISLLKSIGEGIEIKKEKNDQKDQDKYEQSISKNEH
ncbi:outer membrane protein, multidrug efflux system [Azospirillaceae bacterium]